VTAAAVLLYFGLVEWLWGWSTLQLAWRQISPSVLLVALLLLLCSYLLRALRLLDLFTLLAWRRLLPALKLILIHNLLNGLLPLRSGEVSFPLLMASCFSIPLQRSLPALLWLRLIDLYVVLLLALLALLSTLYPTITSQQLLLIALVVLLLPLLLLPLRNQLIMRLVRVDNRPRRWLRRLLEGLPQQVGGMVRLLLWSAANWGLKLAVLAWLLAQFLPSLPFAAAWWGAIGGDLTSVLPIHAPAGLGTYEAGVTAALLPWSVTAAAALPAAVNLHLALLTVMLLGGAIGALLPGCHALNRQRLFEGDTPPDPPRS